MRETDKLVLLLSGFTVCSVFSAVNMNTIPPYKVEHYTYWANTEHMFNSVHFGDDDTMAYLMHVTCMRSAYVWSKLYWCTQQNDNNNNKLIFSFLFWQMSQIGAAYDGHQQLAGMMKTNYNIYIFVSLNKRTSPLAHFFLFLEWIISILIHLQMLNSFSDTILINIICNRTHQ